MNSNIDYTVPSTLIFITLISLISLTNGLRDGDLLKFSNRLDNYVFTANAYPGVAEGVNITAEPWQEESSQQWLAVEAAADSCRFFLLSKRQVWNWQTFAKDTTKGRRKHLPDKTVVITPNVNSRILSQERLTGKCMQQWKTIATKDSFMIKNIKTEECVYNPGVAGVLRTAKCDSGMKQQLWGVDVIKQ